MEENTSAFEERLLADFQKSPYFTLPDLRFYRAPIPSSHCDPIPKLVYKTARQLFGDVARMDEDQKTDFLLCLLRSGGSFQPDFKKAAKQLGTTRVSDL